MLETIAKLRILYACHVCSFPAVANNRIEVGHSRLRMTYGP